MDGIGIAAVGCSIYQNTKAMLIKKGYLKKVGPFNIKLKECETLELTYRLLRNGFHLASTTQAKSHEKEAPKILSRPFFHGLANGYFRAKVLLKYNVPLKAKNLFRGIGIGEWAGFLARWIRFSGSQKASFSNAYRLTRVLSDEGNVYTLNPDLGVHLKDDDILLIDMATHHVIPHHRKLFKDAICLRFISEQIGFFSHNKIFLQVG